MIALDMIGNSIRDGTTLCDERGKLYSALDTELSLITNGVVRAQPVKPRGDVASVRLAFVLAISDEQARADHDTLRYLYWAKRREYISDPSRQNLLERKGRIKGPPAHGRYGV